MTTSIVDAPLLDNTDAALARPLSPTLERARSDVVAAAVGLLTIPEVALTKPWTWKGGSEEEVRYGAYRAAEALEQAEVEARPMVASTEADAGRAARIIGPATAARWDLHGILLPLDESLLDADPGGGEWSIRLVLGHVISAQRAYGWGSAWWQRHPHAADDPALPKNVPEAFWEALPDEAATEAEGGVSDLRARLDTILDLSAERLAGTPDDRLELGARWSGFPVTVGFRLGRWSSHIREHGIQIEKTFAMLGHAPTEPARLVRNLLAAYGRAESVAFGRLGADQAADRVAAGAAEARQAIRAAREAASAG
jgi:DinB superfamily